MTRTRIITIHEIQSLADRILMRRPDAATDPQKICDDWLAANCLRAMSRSFNRTDAVTLDNCTGRGTT
jgi:hypothetical protein